MNDYRWGPMPIGYQITGRRVNSLQEIMPNEVPMDGTMSLFPKSDYSCVYGKMWNTDGTIRTVCYLPQEQPPIDPQAEMLNHLKRIEEMLVKELGLNDGLQTNGNDDAK